MAVRKISDRVYNVGAIDWDRVIFDEIVSTPQGTSYNAYLVKGSEKTALIDTVEPEMLDELLENLSDVGV
ncbi:MAG: FprA family A-type flavoprotein, partial [Euryarchaeota archaeon]|nr:FprA family A-type flavoprotein [Euryarchaeota archaeon]